MKLASYVSHERLVAGAFFLIAMIVGLVSFRDYGIPYDEGTLTQLGQESYAYVVDHIPYPEDTHFRYHGTAVELPIFAAVKAVGPISDQAFLYTRRLVVFCFFFVATLGLFFLGKRIFGDWRLALMGSIFFFVSPHVFAPAFYNSRDVPTMTFFVLGFLTLFRLLERKTILRAVIHGMVCGYVLAIRMPALFLFFATIGFLLWDALRNSNRRSALTGMILMIVVFLFAAAGTTFTFWPLLWEHPIQHFIEAYKFMSALKVDISFLGHTYKDIPWFYIPVWILITTPLLYSFLFFSGLVSISLQLWSERRELLRHPPFPILIPLFWFFGPITSIVVLRAGIYQEWRHVMFVYPAFILIAIHGLQLLTWIVEEKTAGGKNRWMSYTLMAAIGIPVIITATWMIRNHPYENVYYAVPRTWISTTLPLDYWGQSTRHAAKWIHDTDHRTPVGFYSPQNIALLNGDVFYPRQTQHTNAVIKPDYADYIIELQDPPNAPSAFPNQKIVHSIMVDGEALVTIREGTTEGKAFMDAMRASMEQKKS